MFSKKQLIVTLTIILAITFTVILLAVIAFCVFYGATLNTGIKGGYCFNDKSCKISLNLCCIANTCSCSDDHTWSGSQCVALKPINYAVLRIFNRSLSAKINITRYSTMTTKMIYSSVSVTRLNETYYYYADRVNNNIFVTFLNGTYIKKTSISSVTRIVATNKYIYAHANVDYLYKLSFDLDLLVQYYPCDLLNFTCFQSIKEMYFDGSTNLLFIPDFGTKNIYVFDEEMNFQSYVSINDNYLIYGLVVYDGIIYISGFNTIYALNGNTTIQTYANLCPTASNIQSLTVDPNGYLIYPCFFEKTVNIMIPSDKLTLKFGDYTTGVKVDPENRLIVTGNTGLVSIYY